MPQVHEGLEASLERTQGQIEGAARAAQTLGRELKRARAAAASGQLRDLRRSLDTAETTARELAEEVARVRAGYDVDEEELLRSGAYRQELLAEAAAAGVAMVEDEDRLLCYPSIVRMLPADAALDIDRRRERRLRPSVVMALLGRAQTAGPRFRAGPFLASLAGAYDLVAAKHHKRPGAVVRLLDVYAALTLLPGQARDYSRQEFTRDLYLLDQSGVTDTGGRTLRWAASTGTKQAGVLTTVSRSGQQQRYWGIAFAGGDDA